MAKGEDITTRFKVDVSDLKAGISEANRQIKLANAQFKAASAGMDDWKNSSEGVSTKLKQLGTLLTQEQVKLKNYKDQIKAQEDAYKENGKRVEELKSKLKQLSDQGLSKTSDEYKQLKKSLTECEKEQLSNKKTVEELTITMTNQKGTVNKLEKDIKAYTKTLDDLENNQDEVKESIENMSESFTIAKAALADLVADGIRKATEKMKEFVIETVQVGASFDSAMSQVSAVSGATGDSLDKLREKAKEMGATTKFTATESAEAFNYMAMAGWKTEDMLEGIEGVMNLAAASGEDLATTSDIVTDALTGMGYSAKDAGRLADVMAAASSNANTNVSLMGETFKYVTSIAGSLHYSMEDTAVAIGLMANSGIKASQAGTSLRSIMSRIATNTNGAKDAMEELGIVTVNSDGSMRNFGSVMSDLRVSFQKLTSEEQSNYAKTIAGQNALSGFLAIANSSESDFNKLTNAVNNASGASKKMADTMIDNAKGSATILKSEFEGIQIQVYEKLEPSIRKGIKSISKSLKTVDWDEFGDSTGEALDKAVNGFKWLTDHKNQVATALKVMIAAFTVSKINKWTKSTNDVVKGFGNIVTQAKKATVEVTKNTTAQGANRVAQIAGATATSTLTAATKSLSAAFAANPIGFIITGVSTLITLYTTLKGKTDELTKAEKAQKELIEDQTEEVNENINAWKDLEKAKQNSIDTGMTEISHYESLYDELTNLVDANGKVKEGYESRASFIISTLNDAIGTEITMTDGVIQKYDSLKDTIDQVIEKKKAQIILDSQEELYSEAINNQAEATKKLLEYEKTLNEEQQKKKKLQDDYNKAKKEYDANFKHMSEYERFTSTSRLIDMENELKAQKKTVKTTQENYKKQESLLQQYAYNIGLYEQNMALAHEGNYNQMSTVTWSYVKDYQQAGNAEKAQLEEQIKTTQTGLDLLKQWRDKYNTDIYDSQISAGEKQLTSLKEQLTKYESTTDNSLQNVKLKWSKNLDDQLSEITGRKIKFKENSKGNIQAYVDGIKQGEPTSKKEMAKLVENTILEISKQKTGAETAGKNLIAGINDGIANKVLQSDTFKTISNFGKSLLSSLKSSLKEHSPSKASYEDGVNLLLGLSNAIDDRKKSVVNQMKKFGKSIVDTLNNELDVSLDTDFRGSLNSIKNGLSYSSNGIGNIGSNTINSTTKSVVNNYTQNIYSPKEPSRIELYRQSRNLLEYVKGEA